MNIKIIGGSGIHSNTSSCSNLVDYLQHEDVEKLLKGEQKEEFFSLNNDRESPEEVKHKIDDNKGQLLKTDAKFYMIAVSPSEKEIEAMGATKEEQSKNFKNFIKNEVMQKYAENFNKNLNKENIMFSAKIHHERNGKEKANLHAHIIISRKTNDNKIKISPKNTNPKYFNRKELFNNIEKSFDKEFNHDRPYSQSFEYLNTMKNGTAAEKISATEKKVEEERNKGKEKSQFKEQSLQKEKNQDKEKTQVITKTKTINR